MRNTGFGIEPTREAALEQMRAFAPTMGKHYEKQRNYDFGPEDRSNVSMLSPYIRSRLICEGEVVQTALAAHSYRDAEKFIQEVFWRTYWKGWLEMRPSVWADYLSALQEYQQEQRNRPELASAFEAACRGNTEFDCFNAWAKELRSCGYLHNHARMWFASIWIYYLGLPWEMGADFFYRHLLDGDPASNTLSWRWVAGLHTKNKRYVASADNIAKFTNRRFLPSDFGEPEVSVDKHSEEFLRDLLPYAPLPNGISKEGSLTLLICDEDLAPENSPFADARVDRILGLSPKLIQSGQNLSELVLDFRVAALEDGVARASLHHMAPGRIVSDRTELLTSLQEKASAPDSLIGIIAPRIGYWKEFIDALRRDAFLNEENLVVLERPWDTHLFHHATAGYFRFKKQIPAAIETLL